jgi:5-methylcytosine-specific restriction endonuclease McrA
VLVYEGHDHPKTATCPNPKLVDQPGQLPSGKLTQNGTFHRAAQDCKAGRRPPERVRVYEKIKDGIWSYNGVFHLIDSWHEQDERRTVFKFRLVAVEGDEDLNLPVHIDAIEVWKRDGGRCRLCDAADELHFDHIVPFSRGGTSLTADNVQLLCARHNLRKSDHIR